MVVGYRIGPLTYRVLQRLIRTPYISLVNIAAGAMVAPERVQDACNGETLAADLARLLDDPAARTAQAAAQDAALDRMGRGQGDPSANAAEAVIAFLTARGRL
jgi:lipid-A-disaccharide synthase